MRKYDFIKGMWFFKKATGLIYKVKAVTTLQRSITVQIETVDGDEKTVTYDFVKEDFRKIMFSH